MVKKTSWIGIRTNNEASKQSNFYNEKYLLLSCQFFMKNEYCNKLINNFKFDLSKNERGEIIEPFTVPHFKKII